MYMNKITVLRIKVIAVLFTFSLLNSGCVSLKEIRAFATTAGDVGEKFPGLARDLYDSCMSQQRYIVAQKNDFRVDQFADLNDDTNPLMSDGLQICKLYKDEQDRLIKANGTLVGYMKSMGDLAADDLTNYDKSIEGFGSALTGAKLLSVNESNAVTKLAGVLSHLVTEGYRRKKLRNVIKDTDPDIQIIAEALSRIVAMNYVQQLENEREAMKNYYRKLARESVEFNKTLVKNAQGAEGVSNPAPLDDIKTKYEAKNAAINLKIAGAKAYSQILINVEKAHRELANHADDLNSQSTLIIALSYAKTIQGLAADFRKAF